MAPFPDADPGRQGNLRLLIVLAGAAALGVALSCFNPTIVTNTLPCAPLPAKRCPDNFTCVNNLCAAGPGSGGAIGTGGAGTGGRVGTGGAGTGGAGTGGAGTGGAAPPKQALGQTCNTSLDCDQTMQSGTMGVICMEDYSTGPTHCDRVCASDADCPSSFCRGTMVCEVPYVSCDPTVLVPCASTDHFCYLISVPTGAVRAQTVCDLPRDAQPPGGPCSDSRQCVRGLACPPSGGGAGFCEYACNPANGSADCAMAPGTNCRALGAWGYCF